MYGPSTRPTVTTQTFEAGTSAMIDRCRNPNQRQDQAEKMRTLDPWGMSEETQFTVILCLLQDEATLGREQETLMSGIDHAKDWSRESFVNAGSVGRMRGRVRMQG